MNNQNNQITLSARFAYAAPAFALAVVGIPIYVYIPKFYTDVIGINMAVMGTILFSVRLFDAVSDPVIGVLSDATRTRWGRRKPYIFGGALMLALAPGSDTATIQATLEESQLRNRQGPTSINACRALQVADHSLDCGS